MRIDAHQHFWIYTPGSQPWITDGMAALKRDFLPADLEPLLAAGGFDGSIAVQAPQTLEETRWLLRLAEEHSFLQGVVGWVDLCSPRVEDALAELGAHPRLVGLRHLVQDEPDDSFLLRDDFLRGVSRLARHDLAFDVLIYPRQMPAALEFVARFPDQRFVLDHLAKPGIRAGQMEPWAGRLRALARHENLWAKLSGLVTEADWSGWTPGDLRPYLEVALEAFGPGRLMIGSDWPVCTLAGDHARVTAVVQDFIAGLPPREQADILGGAAARAYHLEGTT